MMAFNTNNFKELLQDSTHPEYQELCFFEFKKEQSKRLKKSKGPMGKYYRTTLYIKEHSYYLKKVFWNSEKISFANTEAKKKHILGNYYKEDASWLLYGENRQPLNNSKEICSAGTFYYEKKEESGKVFPLNSLDFLEKVDESKELPCKAFFYLQGRLTDETEKFNIEKNELDKPLKELFLTKYAHAEIAYIEVGSSSAGNDREILFDSFDARKLRALYPDAEELHIHFHIKAKEWRKKGTDLLKVVMGILFSCALSMFVVSKRFESLLESLKKKVARKKKKRRKEMPTKGRGLSF